MADERGYPRNEELAETISIKANALVALFIYGYLRSSRTALRLNAKGGADLARRRVTGR